MSKPIALRWYHYVLAVFLSLFLVQPSGPPTTALVQHIGGFLVVLIVFALIQRFRASRQADTPGK